MVMVVTALKEPIKNYSSRFDNKRKQRQIGRILKHLRDQLYQEQAQIPLPTSWLIDQLVDNALKSFYPEGNDWQHIVSQTLHQIARDTQSPKTFYKREDGVTPLFPNEELMDEWEVKEFVEGVLDFTKVSH